MSIIPESSPSHNPSLDITNEQFDPYRFARDVWDSPEDPRWRQFAKERPRDWGILIRLQILLSKFPPKPDDPMTEMDWLVDPQVGAANKGHAARVLARAREIEILQQDSLYMDVRRKPGLFVLSASDPSNEMERRQIERHANERHRETPEKSPRPQRPTDAAYNEKRRRERAELSESQRAGIESPASTGVNVGDSQNESPDLTPSPVGDSMASDGVNVGDSPARGLALASSLANTSLDLTESIDPNKGEAKAKPRGRDGQPDEKYPNRMQPNEEEINKLVGLGWKAEEIEAAVARVTARPAFKGSAAWEKYLPKLLTEMFPREPILDPMLHSVDGGQKPMSNLELARGYEARRIEQMLQRRQVEEKRA